MTKKQLVLASVVLIALGLGPLATKNTPYIPHKGDVRITAIDNGDDQSGSCEHKEGPSVPHPLKPWPGYVVKPRISHSIAAMAD